MYTVGDIAVHVAEIGHETIKVGYAGTELPSMYERREGRDVEECLSTALAYIGEETQDIPLVYIEDPFATKEARKQVLERVMEEGLCAGVLFMNGAVTDCFSYGKSTGLMIRMGGGSTQVVPVVDGYCLVGGLKSRCGGEELTKYTHKLLASKSKELGTDLLVPQIAIEEKKRVVLEQMPEYKEKESYRKIGAEKIAMYEMEVARHFKESMASVQYSQPKYYEFGTEFTTRILAERTAIPQRLFDKEGSVIERLDPQKQMSGALGKMGMLDMTKAVIEAVDMEYYDILLGNVMIAGGGAQMNGISECMQTELAKMFANSRVKVSNDRREFSTYFGGSILGSLSTAYTLMITKAEYTECGASVLERKRAEWIK